MRAAFKKAALKINGTMRGITRRIDGKNGPGEMQNKYQTNVCIAPVLVMRQLINRVNTG